MVKRLVDRSVRVVDDRWRSVLVAGVLNVVICPEWNVLNCDLNIEMLVGQWSLEQYI